MHFELVTGSLMPIPGLNASTFLLDFEIQSQPKWKKPLKPNTVRAAIDAPLEKVWKLWTGPEPVTQWNHPSDDWHTTHASNDLQVSGKFLFLGSDEERDEAGMVSQICKNIPNEFVTIQHVGILQDGKEITDGKDADGRAGSFENYTYIKEGEHITLLIKVDLDAIKEYKSYFSETYPKALELLKKNFAKTSAGALYSINLRNLMFPNKTSVLV